MKKKVLLVLALGLIVISLGSCNLLSGTNQSVNYIYSDATVVAMQNSVTDVFNKVNKACVGVYTKKSSTETYSGSGVIYKIEDSYAYLVTNEHVIEGGTSYKVFLGGSTYYNATLIGSDAKNDIAVLRFTTDLTGGDITAIDIMTVENVTSIGDTVVAIGCPLGFNYYNTCTTGNISNVYPNKVQHSAPINPGSSGGGLFNLNGGLVGINVSKLTTVTEDNELIPIEAMCYSIPMRIVVKCVNDIEAKKTAIERPILGITVKAVNKYISPSQEVAYLPSIVEQGIVVFSVENISVAKLAGVKEFDVIYAINDNKVTTQDELSAYLSTTLKGDTIKLSVYRKSGITFTTADISILLA